MTERRPATEAGRRVAAWLAMASYLTLPTAEWPDVNEAILAIEAQATDARVAALTEALRDFGHVRLIAEGEGYEEWHLNDCTYRGKGYAHLYPECDRARALLSDLPAAAAERPLDVEPEIVARWFHEAYERLAPDYGYKTREASAVPWEQVPENNRALMTATASAVLARLSESDR